MATVSLEQVSKVYPNGLPAVSDLDLDVAEGEPLVLVGSYFATALSRPMTPSDTKSSWSQPAGSEYRRSNQDAILRTRGRS